MTTLMSRTANNTPVRINTTDDPASILRFAAEEARKDGAALATLVEIRGGAARALGSHIAIAADGRFCGYVSGGCVEAAVAAEALSAIEAREDRIVMFGVGSPFFDIVLPCGGGITIAIHVVHQPEIIEAVLERIGWRQEACLRYRFDDAELDCPHGVPLRSAWQHGEMQTIHRPTTRLILSGQTGETSSLQVLAEASGYHVLRSAPNADPSEVGKMIDRFTAVVLLHHDLDAEAGILEEALRSRPFYVGALGSTRTHHTRVKRLMDCGFTRQDVDRIRAPIGMFGPTRDFTSLSISVLADVTASRLAIFG